MTAAALSILAAGRAAASVSLAGSWHAEPMTVRWVIGQWGEECGPRPSGGGDAGGTVTIEEQGRELRISGLGKTYSTDECWAMHPELSRQSHSATENATGRVWKTLCRTGGNDARQEILQTTVTATGDMISFQESGQYQFSIQGQACSASSGRWRIYRRQPAAPEPLAPPAPPTPDRPCATPGLPARIEVRPARKLMRAGESFQFSARVTDARGCVLRTPVNWALEPSTAPAELEGGKLTVAAGAPDADLRVTATAAQRAVAARVEVVSDDRYAALLETGDFDAEGASGEAAAAAITSGAIGAQPMAPDASRPRRKWTFVAVVIAIALGFAVVGAVLLQRARRVARERRRARAAQKTPGTLPRAAGVGPRWNPAETRVEATRLESDEQRSLSVKAKTVCPVCGTLYDIRDLEACPKDGARVLPVNA